MPENFFLDFDNLLFESLGTNKIGDPNFMAVPFNEGMVYLHCQPLAFTNYHILYGNKDYVRNVLSYLPVTNTIWDEYYKPFANHEISPVRYILKESPLKFAYLFTLVMILIYMIFGSKRKQRYIKIITPLHNESLQFIKNVGQLYFKSKNHADLAKKKIIYFKEFLRNRYNISQIPIDERGIGKMAYKSGVDEGLVKSIVGKIKYMEIQSYIHQDLLIELHKKIEEFKKNCI